jgi:cell division protein FtsB
MINQPKLSPDLSHLVSVPYRESLPPELAGLPPHITQEYLPPVAAALHFLNTPSDGNISPSHYTRSTMNRKIFARATLLTAFLALAVSILLVKELVAVSRLKASINRVKITLSGSAKELADFRKLDSEVKQLKQPIEVLNGHNSSLNPSAALVALNLPVSADYQIKGVTLQRSGERLELQIEGTLTNSNYSNTQGAYEKLLAQVAQLPGYAAVSGNVDIMQRTYSILARYDGGGQKSR